MRTRLLAGLLLTLAAPASAIDAHRMQCIFPDGSIQLLAIDGAREFAGGVTYRIGDERTVTTRDCLFNTGPMADQPAWGNIVGPVLMTCDRPDGMPAYAERASHATLRAGVWIWREDETGDRYLSTAPCITGPTW